MVKSRRDRLSGWFFYDEHTAGVTFACTGCDSRTVALTSGDLRPTRDGLVGTPWRIVQTLRENRSETPVPALYVTPLIAGAVAGTVADLILGVPWWWGPVSAVAATWLYFLSSAFWGEGGGDLGLELKIALRPSQDSRLRDAHTARLLRDAPFPLLGLNGDWRGHRWIGGFATSRRGLSEIDLAHGRKDDRGVITTLLVGVAPLDQTDTHRALARAAFRLIMWLEPSAHRLGLSSEEKERRADIDRWSSVQIPVDGVLTNFRSVSGDGKWVAVGRVGTIPELVVSIKGCGFDPRQLSLSTVADVQPYLIGSQQLRGVGLPPERPE